MLINYNNNNHNQMSTLSPPTSYSQSILPNDIIRDQSSLSNLIESVNNNNLYLHYSNCNSSFTQKIDELNLLFYIETERILSKSNKCLTSTSTSIQRQDDLLLILLFKQIRLYISEIDRLNWLIKESRDNLDALYKEAKEEKQRHRIEIGTKDKIITTLKESIVVLEQSLLSRLKTHNNNINDNACIGDYSNNISQLPIDDRYCFESQSFDIICSKQQRYDHANSHANGRNGNNQCESIVMSGSVIRNSLNNNNTNKNRSNNGAKYKKKGNIRIIKDLKEAIAKGKASSMEFQKNSHINHNNSNKGASNGKINSNGIVFKLKSNDFKLRNTFNTENNRYIEIME